MNNLTQNQANPSEHEIALQAYLFWEAAGRPHGQSLEHWLAAEAQLRKGAPSSHPPRLPGSRYGLVLKS